MEQVKISQVAKILGVSLNSVYHKVKQNETKLNDELIKTNGVTYVTKEGIEILRGLFVKLNPSESATNKEDSSISCLKEIIQSAKNRSLMRNRKKEAWMYFMKLNKSLVSASLEERQRKRLAKRILRG
jgi:hypothetical protein